jgi:hypothetical protein
VLADTAAASCSEEAGGKPPAREDLLDDDACSVIRLARRDHVVAGIQRLEQRSRRRRARREGEGRSAVLDGGHDLLEGGAVGVAGAPVRVAVGKAPVDRALEGRREYERLDDRAVGFAGVWSRTRSTSPATKIFLGSKRRRSGKSCPSKCHTLDISIGP